METNGWIKLYRKEHEWACKFSDREWRFYSESRLFAIWDVRNKDFGTFDVRTRIIKRDMLPQWSTGKINIVKNLLLKKHKVYQKTDDPRRLKIINAKLFFERSRRFEKLIQQSEKNLHYVEYHFQLIESVRNDIARMRADVARNKRVSHEKDSAS